MPSRLIVAEELSKLLARIAHPRRIRIIEELGHSEMDVQTLVKKLKLTQTAVSQALSHLRMQGLVHTRRDGKHVYYSLKQPWLAQWLLQGLDLIEEGNQTSIEVIRAAKKAKQLWASEGVSEGSLKERS